MFMPWLRPCGAFSYFPDDLHHSLFSGDGGEGFTHLRVSSIFHCPALSVILWTHRVYSLLSNKGILYKKQCTRGGKIFLRGKHERLLPDPHSPEAKRNGSWDTLAVKGNPPQSDPHCFSMK